MNEHTPCGIGMKVVSRVADKQFKYEQFVGEDCMQQFLNRLLEIEQEILDVLFDEKRIKMEPWQYELHADAKECYLCKKPFTKKDYKVR